MNNVYQQDINDIYKERNILIILIGFFLSVIIISLTILFLNSNKNTKLNRPKIGDGSRTVMIYTVGADLEGELGLATIDLDGIDYESTSKNNINVYVIAGGTKKWQNNYIDSSKTTIFKLGKNGYEKQVEYERQDMGDYRILSNFLNYVYENSMTDKYELVFWDHGGAVYGSEFDELTGENLTLDDMRLALASSPFDSENKLESVAFRTCLNGTLEVANVFDEYADYMIASEEVTLGTRVGGSVFEFLNDLTYEDDGLAYSTKFVENYKQTIRNYCKLYDYSIMKKEYCQDITYAVFDLNKVEKLNTDVDDFFLDINGKLNTEYAKMARVRANLTQYGKAIPEYDMIDLYSLVEQYKEFSNDKADKVLADLDELIVYSYSNIKDSKGISTYFPYKGQNFLPAYNSVKYSDNYAKFIANFTNIKNSTTISNFSIKDNSILSNKVDNEQADLEMEFTDQQLSNYSSAKYMVFVDMKDGNYRPIRSSKNVYIEDNKLKASIKGKQLRVTSSETGNSTWLYLVEVESNDDYTEYETNVVLENVDEEEYMASTLTIIVDKDHPTGYISGVKSIVTSDEKSMGISSVALDINDYQYISFSGMNYKIFDENGNYTKNWQTNGVITGKQFKIDGFKFEVEDFDSEYDYYGLFTVSDVTDKSYTSNLIKLD